MTYLAAHPIYIVRANPFGLDLRIEPGSVMDIYSPVFRDAQRFLDGPSSLKAIRRG